MKIYIGFSHPQKWTVFARLIAWIESRPYDHCYVRFQEPAGDWMIFQASGLFVNLFPLDRWQSINVPVKEYEIEISDEQYQALWKYIKSNLGLPYSLKEDFGILLMKIFKLKTNPYSTGGRAEFCAEEAANVGRLVGLPIPINTSSLDPSELDSILSQAQLPVTNFAN